MMFFVNQGGLYSAGLIPTPGFNQSSKGECGKYSNPVCLSVQLLGVATGFLLGALQLVLVCVTS